ncbi:probable ATP-dependent RNA helicase DDX58 [Trichomycterus rosablanca]|uniref:probable ATP-dependent RNA helicase DDX58 n=1 Tax=Trichomycterus rosablanca TaxID=2290929 RepID=UPI002F356CFB
MYELERKNLQLYSRYVTQFLRPSYIQDFMRVYLDTESVQKIVSQEGRGSVSVAAQMLLEKMLNLQEEGWFQAFLDILLASEYTGLHRAIKEWDFEELNDLEPHRKLLDRIEMSITRNMKPRELLPHMNECLTDRECEEIRAVEDNKGCIAASERLLESLRHCDKPNWFKTLKLALEACSQKLALQLLEPDSNSKCVEECEESMDCTQTVCFEYREDGESNDDLMSSNEMMVTEEHSEGAGSEAAVERATERKLREYQKELARDACSGHNTIICAPTGCGKTIVALEICENHLKKFPQKAKVVFMATKVEVYMQQYKLFKDHFSKDTDISVIGLCGDKGDMSLSTLLTSYDVLVLTPQILVNALDRGEVSSLHTFTLLLLDECHNTTGKHPYNIIMNRYIDAKHSPDTRRLPQVVGLTASVGIGTFKTEQEAEMNICQLCANLDARLISTVTEHVEELRSFVYVPEKDFFQVPQRTSDPFILIISSIMKDIERLAMSVHNIGGLSQVQRGDFGSQMYEQWIVDVQKQCKLLQLQDPEEEKRICRALYTYTEHLRKYNDALIINEDARAKDALDYLDLFIQDIDNAAYDENERRLADLFRAQHQKLLHLATEGNENPKLQELKFILDEEYRNNKQTRTVLFVRTRALADAMKKWIEETDSLKFLKPGVLIGRGRRSQLMGSGMTLPGQKGVLESFKSSDDSKILIATSVADEGIDIPQCNLVLMYEYVGNVVKMVQVRGRGRAQGSRCFLISSGPERINKEKLNMAREKLVEAAITNLQHSLTQLQAQVDRFQREDMARRAHVQSIVEKPRTEGSYMLLCAKCRKFTCYSDDLRVLQKSHHIVLDRSIFERCITKPYEKIKVFDGISKNKKMFCANCNREWGITASYMSIQDLPVLKIEGFIFKDLVTEKLQVFRKWRDVTFKMKEFDVTEKTVSTWEPRT